MKKILQEYRERQHLIKNLSLGSWLLLGVAVSKSAATRTTTMQSKKKRKKLFFLSFLRLICLGANFVGLKKKFKICCRLSFFLHS